MHTLNQNIRWPLVLPEYFRTQNAQGGNDNILTVLKLNNYKSKIKYNGMGVNV